MDLGCGTGDVATLLAKKASNIVSIDFNNDVIEFAKQVNGLSNVQYICKDLKKINELELPLADGIWSSFTVAFFPNFTPILRSWLNLLKPGGWIAFVEMNDLFAHRPIDLSIENTFKSYYQRQRNNNVLRF